MNGPQNHREAATPYGMNWSVKPWMESIRLTMAEQESVFHYQLEELHRIYRKQVELMEELEGTVIGRSQQQLESIRKRVKKLKLELEEEMVNFNELIEVPIQVSKDTDAPATPETTNFTVARGKQVLREEEQARSAAVALVAMSSSLVGASSDRLLWFAKTVTSARRDADLASVVLKQKQMSGQHGKHCTRKKKKGTKVKACLASWGRITKGRRSKRVPAEDPAFTFERGALLTRWR